MAGMFLILVLCLIFYLSEKRKLKKLKLITSAQITPKLVSNNSIRQKKFLNFLFLLAEFLFLLIGLARPQWGTEKKVSSDYSMDILIAVDVSKSMLADDISPSRLNKVKSSIATFTRNCRKSFRAVLFFW